MGMRYRKRIRVLPGVKLNISRSSRGWNHSWSLSAFGVTHNTRSKRNTVDLPGGLYYTTGGKGSRKGSAKRSQRPAARLSDAAPVPYAPRKWPYAVLAILTFLAFAGGAYWQPLVVFGFLALVVFGVQRVRAGDAMPVHRDTGTPAPEPVEPAMDPDEAERIVRDWTAPKDTR